jgi:hypothetical protein
MKRKKENKIMNLNKLLFGPEEENYNRA